MIERWKRKGNELTVYDPEDWGELNDLADSVFGSGLGYRQYSHIIIYDICKLWPERIGHFLGSLYHAMELSSQLELRLLPPTKEYKTFHDFEYFSNILKGKGYSNIKRQKDWIRAEKL